VRSKFCGGLQKTAGVITGLAGRAAKAAVKNPLEVLNQAGNVANAYGKGTSTAEKLKSARESSGSVLR
jgi:hypothetical protein